MKKITYAFVALSLVSLTKAQDVSTINDIVSIYDFQGVNGSARYVSMGGSMGALGGDISATIKNPGALGVNLTNEFQATMGINSYKNATTYNGNHTEYKNNITNIQQIGAVLAMRTDDFSKWKAFNIGINYNNANLDNYIETDVNNRNINLLNFPSYYLSRHAYSRTGNYSVFNFGIGGNYDNKIYLGASFNLKSIDLTSNDAFELTNGTQSYEFHKQYTPNTTNSNAFSFSAGIIGKINKNLRLGLAIQTPTWWNSESLYTEYGLNNNNKWSSLTYQDSKNITTPAKATASIGYVFGKSLALNADYSIGFTKPKISGANLEMQNQFNSFINSEYKNISEISVGGEYRLKDVSLRAGYSYSSNPFKTSSLKTYNEAGLSNINNYKNMYVSSRSTYAFGLGYNFRPFYVNVAYQMSQSSFSNPFFGGQYASLSNGSWDGDGFDNETSVVSSVKNTQNNVLLSLGFRF
ncbi:hemin receptor [Ornithobacterium rhinotracheale]|uniref:Hemin receptor n=1 Tax=Ornithobacterium rhinotracheale TaxID=28251 RepID=A0A3R5Y2F4_ORNRH|nr:hemin receptor [Ornithobacterium rhinotracheale]QAR30182.1 hemin receptor [Ornithobacterium rhinotracheale]